ncbi:unnamed protein product [Rhizoctonia solani]|uniref:Jacalin-type lectin domain-containing protein n=1 Tax=Rhizoctonia solani TaxID=456999 RepID=A0A8H2XNA3_9AGAM|nr:unnamed protein product [Rhizoctonia solani]
MSSNHSAPSNNNGPPPPEPSDNHSGGLNENILRAAGWLRGLRVDNIYEPQVSIRRVASYADGASPSIEEANKLSTEFLVTNTKREANYVHRGWSIGAIKTICPWTSSRIAANNQHNAEGIWYTRLTRIRLFRVQVLLEDLVPMPEFEAAIEEALRQPTTFEKFQAVYRALARWSDVVPLEIELGSSFALTDTEMNRLQLPETGERNYNNIAWFSKFKTGDITITGGEPRWSDGNWSTMDARDSERQVIKIGKVASTTSLLASDLQTQLSDLTYDDNQHASKTISSVTIRSSDYIELLSIIYFDGTTSGRHGGGGHVGIEYKFTLATDEHITEMLTWTNGEWLLGLQFVTNRGRCSPQYGANLNVPCVARAKGGVLVGFLSHTKLHPDYKEMFSGVQGIWRHDVLPRVPKEEDVYSEYFGDKDSSWHENAFNDRVLVGNSKSIYISCVKVRSGAGIDGIQFIYKDNKDGQESEFMSPQHGGPGGSLHQFVLGNGEHIVSVVGRHGEKYITQLCFGTNRVTHHKPSPSTWTCGNRRQTGDPGLPSENIPRMERTEATGNDNNCNAHPPAQDPDLDILATTSLKNSEDKDTLLRNIGYLCGIRVDDTDGPRNLTRQVAKFVGDQPPFVQEMMNFLTETIKTSTERDTNYIHHGWSIDAVSTISPWTASRIASNNHPNADGTWLTRRTLVQRFAVQHSLGDLAPVPEFKAEIEAALEKPSIFQKFEAVYRALHKWGDVVPLEVEMGVSLTFTDLETNMSKLPDTAQWNNTHYLTTIRTARTTRQAREGTDGSCWGVELWPNRTMSPLHWRRIRVTKVASTTKLLPAELQGQLLQLYSRRLSYVPAITVGPSDSTCRAQDGTPSDLRQVSGVVLYASDWIRSMRFVYVDKMGSTKHEGSEKCGSEYTFMLKSEMLIWRGDWVEGLQFITSFGRCSPHFGGNGHAPVVARSKGGILVGIISMVKENQHKSLLFRKIQGIWRHDVVNKAPKEDDVFSDYYGSKDKGRPFNDRVVVGNSDIAISRIDVRCGSAIDSLQFTYTDDAGRGGNEYQTEDHGGPGGDKKQFILESGEHILSVTGRYDNERITQLCFVTNKGRTSEVFGQGKSIGSSHSISVSSPKDKEGKRMRLQYVCGKSDNNAPLPPGFTTGPSGNDQILKNAGWLCGFRVDNMDGPQVVARQVASYVDGAALFVEEKDDIFTEIITTHLKHESHYVHQGWSVGAVTTVSPWTLSRRDATNRYNAGGTWITRRTLALRLRLQVLLEDLVPAPEFEAAIEEALTRPSRFEKFQAVYQALSRWGDVVPLEIELGSSLSLTDTEANFAQLPVTTLYNSFTHLSTIKTANIARKGVASNLEWREGTWTMAGVPATGWRPIRIVTVVPTISLLADSLQARLTKLYAERFSYVPSLMFDPIGWQCKTHDDTNNASRTISSVEIHGTDEIIGLSIKYLDGVVSRGGRDAGNRHTFALNSGEHIVEILTCTIHEWRHGIQFITNTGRCSVIYGMLEGTPIISRSKGGVLAGFSTSSKEHPEWNYLITGVRGIWRYDLLPRVPKENDVYSDYYGAATEHGKGFNDRALIGNSNSMRISSIEVWSGAGIDGIQVGLKPYTPSQSVAHHSYNVRSNTQKFTYTDDENSQNDKLKTACHGGSGGAHHSFELRNGEYIVSASGRFNEEGVTQLCFVTNLSRRTEVYGEGDGQPFSALAPPDESGRYLRLQYILGKSDDTQLNGVMFVWTPNLP